jgi:hypothetical protein
VVNSHPLYRLSYPGIIGYLGKITRFAGGINTIY